MPQPRRPRGATATAPPRPQPAAGNVAAGAAALAAAMSVPGPGLILAGGAAYDAQLADLTAAEARAVVSGTIAVLRRLSIIRRDALAYDVAGAFVTLRPTATAREVRIAADAEALREGEFRKRQLARVRRDLAAVLREADPKRRAKRLRGVVGRERNYNRLRERAIADRSAGAADARNALEASPEGAIWMLGHRAEHCPGCAFLAGQALPWGALIAGQMIPPLGPGCGCRLRGVRQAWLMSETSTLRRVLDDADAAATLAQARALGHPHAHDGGVTLGLAA